MKSNPPLGANINKTPNKGKHIDSETSSKNKVFIKTENYVVEK